MDLLGNIALGLAVALTPENILFCFVGAMIGTLIGVLPGIGPVGALAMLLPVTFYMAPTGALIMLAGIYYGSQYGGSTTAILVNIPGESSSVIACIDGHQMAQQGRAGAALAIAALGSLFAGTIATLLIALAAVPLASVALSFGSPEYFALMFLGLTGAVVLASGSTLKAVGMVVLGLALGLVGTDLNSGIARFTFGYPALLDGIGFVAMAIGVMGITEIVSNLEQREIKPHQMAAIGRLWPTRQEFRQAWPASIRGTAIGSVLGLLPGGGALMSAFTSYTVEKKLAKDPSRFGHGAVEGLAGPESANNASAQTSFIPMLTLGIPSTAVMAIMVGALMIQGIVPGPEVMTGRPDLFWGLIASMWVGNLMLVVINLPMIGLWVKLLKVPYRLLFPCIILMCAVGAYSLSNSTFDVVMVAGFAVVGYLLRKVGCEPAPFALGFILGPLMETSLRRSMLLADGNPMIFLRHPISAALLLIAAGLVVMIVLPNFRKAREVVFQE